MNINKLHIYLSLSLITLLSIPVIAEDFVFYQLKKGEYISEALNDLGVCPLYGKKGKLKKVLTLNKDINPDKINNGQMLKLPYSFLSHPDKVLFFSQSRVRSKANTNNLCAKIKKVKIKRKMSKVSETIFAPLPIKLKDKSDTVNINASSKVELLERPSEKTFIQTKNLPKVITIISPSPKFQKDLVYTIIFNKPVKVTGKPNLKIKINNTINIATFDSIYKNSINFKYRIPEEIKEISKVSLIPQFLFSDGQITSSSGVLIEELFVLPGKESTIVKESTATFPRIVNVNYPDNTTFRYGEKVQIHLTFNKKVKVSGFPLLLLRLDSGDVFAKYMSGSGSNKITFNYYVHPSDLDLSGVEIVSPIEIHNSLIKDMYGNVASLNIDKIKVKGMLVDGSSLYKSISSFNYISKRYSIYKNSSLEISSQFSSQNLELFNTNNLREADISSTSSSTVSLAYIKPITQKWGLLLETSFSQLKFENDISTNKNYRAQLGTRYISNKALSFSSKLGIENRPYLSHVAENLSIISVTNFRFDSQVRWVFLSSNNHSLGTKFGFHYLFAKANQNMNIKEGYGGDFAIFSESDFDSFRLRFEVNGGLTKQKIDQVEQRNKYFGFSLQYIIPFKVATLL